MDRLDLIRLRGFGEKFNELTSLVYGHFGQLVRGYKWHLLILGALVAALNLYFPTYDVPLQLLQVYLISLVLLVPIVKQTIAVDWQQQKFIPVLVRTLITSFLPFLVFCLAEYWLLKVHLLDSISYTIIILFFFYLILLLLLSVPLFQIINVSVFEQKKGFDAVRRAISILRCRPFRGVLFLGIVAFIGLLVPSISRIPYSIVTSLAADFTSEYTQQPNWEYHVLLFLSEWVECIFFVLYVMLFGLATVLEYGSVVEEIDNVHFTEKFNNFDNL